MQESRFRRWVEINPKRPIGKLSDSSISTYVTDAKRVEKHYGDLDALYVKDRFKGFFRNPTRIPTTKAGLGGYKTAIRHYRDFLDELMRSSLLGK